MWLASLTSHIFKAHSCYSLCQYFIPLCGWGIFCCFRSGTVLPQIRMLNSYPLKLQSVALFGSRITADIISLDEAVWSRSVHMINVLITRGHLDTKTCTHVEYHVNTKRERDESHACTTQEHQRLPATHQKLGDKHIFSLPDVRRYQSYHNFDLGL